MLKLFRYLKKAYVPVIAIVLLLILQASCDLTLPTFTSNIVNVGIQQKGIEDAVPDVMREETFLALKSLMKQDDADDMEDAYKLYTKDQVKDSKYKDYKDGRLYVRRYISKKDREHLDTSMSKAMLKLSAQMAKQIQANPQAAASLSKSQKKMMAQMKNMDTKDMPDTIISQAAISFVTSEYKAIGLDIDQMQTHYLLVTGAKMIGLAGGSYVPQTASEEENALSTMNMQMETFYAEAKDADIPIYNSTIDGELETLDQLLAKSPLLADFKAVKEGNVWCTGKNMFQETMGLGNMILDLHTVFAEEEPADGELHYLHRLQ